MTTLPRIITPKISLQSVTLRALQKDVRTIKTAFIGSLVDHPSTSIYHIERLRSRIESPSFQGGTIRTKIIDLVAQK